jgi:hypothetical protein
MKIKRSRRPSLGLIVNEKKEMTINQNNNDEKEMTITQTNNRSKEIYDHHQGWQHMKRMMTITKANNKSK